ncbi:MAG: nucleotidyltransferase domain-containing protein [Angelakisella sp.]
MTEQHLERLLRSLVSGFGDLAGVDAIVLGGSQPTRTSVEGSDIDIGIYYNEETLDLTALQKRGQELDDQGREKVITQLGEWGPWINGGGWLTVEGIPVDILFRSSRKVASVIDDCLSGIISIDYQCGHPFGFVNAIYMGELASCRILHCNNRVIPELRERLSTFPEGYRRAAIEKFLWECDFSLKCGHKAVSRGDVLYAAGSLFRSAICLLQVLYAYNGLYMLNEKGSLGRLQKKPDAWMPSGFAQAVTQAMELNPHTLADAFYLMQQQLEAVTIHCR